MQEGGQAQDRQVAKLNRVSHVYINTKFNQL